MKIRTLLLLACCMLLQSHFVLGKTKVSPDTLALYKNDYPRRGYRSFLDFGASTGDFDLAISMSNIHGAQIFPQLFVGVGGMVADVIDEGEQLWRVSTFLDIRYDALKSKVTPFVDCRIGHSWGEFCYVDDDCWGGNGFYFSPSIGCRVSRFNFSVFYDYQKYDWRFGELDFSNYGFRLGWDFGSRWKNYAIKREFKSLYRNTRSVLAPKQARMIVDYGLLVVLHDDYSPLVWNISVVRGQQIIPQLFIGGGLVFEHTRFERMNYEAWTDSRIQRDFDVTAACLIPVLSIRYDIFKTPVSPFIETKVGGRIKLMHSDNETVPISKPDILYISPSIGARFGNFNISASYENQNPKVDVDGRYVKYSFTKNIHGVMFHMGFDFGARTQELKKQRR